MNTYIVLFLYILTFALTVFLFYKYWKKRIFASILAGLIVGQLALILISYFLVFSPVDGEASRSSSTELIFWAINLITPFIVYISFLYFLYRKNL